MALGLATVVTLLLFVDALFERFGAVVVVLASVVAYLVAQAVTAAAAQDN